MNARSLARRYAACLHRRSRLSRRVAPTRHAPAIGVRQVLTDAPSWSPGPNIAPKNTAQARSSSSAVRIAVTDAGHRLSISGSLAVSGKVMDDRSVPRPSPRSAEAARVRRRSMKAGIGRHKHGSSPIATIAEGSAVAPGGSSGKCSFAGTRSVRADRWFVLSIIGYRNAKNTARTFFRSDVAGGILAFDVAGRHWSAAAKAERSLTTPEVDDADGLGWYRCRTTAWHSPPSCRSATGCGSTGRELRRSARRDDHKLAAIRPVIGLDDAYRAVFPKWHAWRNDLAGVHAPDSRHFAPSPRCGITSAVPVAEHEMNASAGGWRRRACQ